MFSVRCQVLLIAEDFLPGRFWRWCSLSVGKSLNNHLANLVVRLGRHLWFGLRCRLRLKAMRAIWTQRM